MTDKVNPEFIENNFPTLKDMTYLNNASTGIPPRSTIEAMHHHLEGRITAKGNLEKTLSLIENVRDLLAQLLGGSKTNYGLVPNTSLGLNIVAHGVEYPNNANIVICDLEFPANYVPWQHAARLYDVELRVVKSKDGAAPAEEFLELIDENTKIVAVSLVQFGTGYRIDLERLAKAIHEVNGILVVDIIQAAGWANIDLTKLDVDFAAAQAAKWLVGPIGAGFIFTSDRALEMLRPRFTGWWGIENITEFEYAERTLYNDARKFQTGSLPVIAYAGFLESLNLLLQIPAVEKEKIAMENADYLRQRLSEEGFEFYNHGTKNNSPIVSFVTENVEKMHKKLTEQKIYCAIRNGRLRVSPHFYNTKSDIDRLMLALVEK